MGKMNELATELAELRRCGEILIGVANTLGIMLSGEEAEAPVVAPPDAPAGVKKEYSFNKTIYQSAELLDGHGLVELP